MEHEERKIAFPQEISDDQHPKDESEVSSVSHENEKEIKENIWDKSKGLFSIFFPEVTDSQSKIYMIIWALIYIISLTIFILQFKPLVEKYLSMGVSVAVTIEHTTSLKFPQITICPASMFEKSKIRGVKKRNLYQLAILDDLQKEYMLKYIATKDDVTISETVCPNSMIMCSKAVQCIPRIWLCDGTNDCVDNSDEDDELHSCSTRTTGTPTACIGEEYKPCQDNKEMCAVYCNDNTECNDGSDEMQCTVAQPQVNLTASFSIQTVMSHADYPLTNYPKNTKTITKIDPINASYPNILINFERFIVHEDTECSDYLEILDANEKKPTNWKKSKYCGSEVPSSTIVEAPIKVIFFTNNIWSAAGYCFTYIATSDNVSSERTKRSANYGDYFDYFANDDYADAFGVDIKKDLSLIKNITGQDWRSVYYKLRELDPPEFNMADAFAVFSPEIPYLYGVSLEDIVVDCAYGSSDCDSDNKHFQTLVNSKLGKCYMFNSAKRNNSRRVSSRSGISNGLVLTLFLNDDESVGFLTQDSGISVTINPSNIYPLPHQNSIVVKPGSSTVISIKQKSIHRLNRSANPCTNVQKNWIEYEQIREAYFAGHITDEVLEALENGSSTYDDPYHTWSGYSQQVCYETCLYENLKALCGCVDSYLYTYQGADDIPKSPYPVCSPWNSTQIICKQSVYTKFKNQEELMVECDCPRSCEDKLYEISSATSVFPSKNYLYYFLQLVRKSKGEGARKFAKNLLKLRASGAISDAEILTRAQKNFLRVEIYFEELNFELIKESKAYSFEELLAAFAGNIGMFVGWSVLTFSHILIYILNMCMHIFTTR